MALHSFYFSSGFLWRLK